MPSEYVNWKKVLGIPENNHHKLCPLIPEVLWDIMKFLNYESLNGEISGGMFQAYIRLLRIHGLLKKDCVFYKRTYYYILTVKGKKVCRKRRL